MEHFSEPPPPKENLAHPEISRIINPGSQRPEIIKQLQATYNLKPETPQQKLTATPKRITQEWEKLEPPKTKLAA